MFKRIRKLSTSKYLFQREFIFNLWAKYVINTFFAVSSLLHFQVVFDKRILVKRKDITIHNLTIRDRTRPSCYSMWTDISPRHHMEFTGVFQIDWHCEMYNILDSANYEKRWWPLGWKHWRWPLNESTLRNCKFSDFLLTYRYSLLSFQQLAKYFLFLCPCSYLAFIPKNVNGIFTAISIKICIFTKYFGPMTLWFYNTVYTY